METLHWRTYEVILWHRFWRRIAWLRSERVPNNCNCPQHLEYTHICLLIHNRIFEMMSSPTGKIQSHKYLQLTKHNWFRKKSKKLIWITDTIIFVECHFWRLFHILKPNEHIVTIEIDVRYRRRLPTVFTVEIRNMLADIPRPALMTVVKFALIGVPNALSTWIM